MNLLKVTPLAALAAMALVAPGASGHVKNGERWYYAGSTYKESSGSETVDPINITFVKSGTRRATESTVAAAFRDRWDESKMGGDGRMEEQFCNKGKQYMRFFHYPGTTGPELDFTHSTSDTCKDQFHFRKWIDDHHANRVSSHGAAGQWTIGGIHHEVRCSTPFACKHKIDRDWDMVERQATQAMSYYCSRRWRYHPGSYGHYQDYQSDGYITLLSMRPRSEGCG